MTDDLKAMLEEIEKRAESATEGPWEVLNSQPLQTIAVAHSSKYSVPHAVIGRNIPREYGDNRPTDAEFIAHARTDVPKLLAVIKRLRSELDEMRIGSRDSWRRHMEELDAELVKIMRSEK